MAKISKLAYKSRQVKIIDNDDDDDVSTLYNRPYIVVQTVSAS